MNQLAARTETPYELIVQSGPEKGSVYKLYLGKISIGRGTENDIVFANDPKISRQQVVLDVRPNVVEIIDVSKKDKLIVNGERVPKAQLVKGSTVQLGDTVLLFNAQIEASAELSLVSNLKPIAQTASPGQMHVKKQSRRSRGSKNSKLNFYIILGAILTGGYFLSQVQTKNSTDEIIRNSTEYNEALAERQKQIEEMEKSIQTKKQNTPGYADAQVNFVKGFRDYQKGQYDRAVDSFNACARILPQCERYLGLARKKLGDLIQSEMNYGRKYLDQGLYQPCRSTFKNVMFLIKDKTSPIYKEAEQNYTFCLQKESGRF